MVPYSGRQCLDLYEPTSGGPAPVVLLWHGVGSDQRDVLAPLARCVAALGALVFVPDWRSDDAKAGACDLLASLAFVQRRAVDPARITVAGWSMGGRAAAGLATNPAGGWQPAAVVCLGSSYLKPAATSGTSPLTDLSTVAASPVPFWIVHGIHDRVVPVERSRTFAAELTARAWPVELHEVPSDHAGVVMAEYDPDLQRCRPTSREHALAAGRLSASVIARACGL